MEPSDATARGPRAPRIRDLLFCLLGALAMCVHAADEPLRLQALPREPAPPPVQTDWLLDSSPYRAGVFRTDAGDEIVLSNGLIRRAFRLSPNAATVALDNLVSGQALLRGVKPEAQVTLDGRTVPVGGLIGQPNYAYLDPSWIGNLESDPEAMRFVGAVVTDVVPRLEWLQTRRCAPGVAWPPKGIGLRFDYDMPEPDLSALLPPDSDSAVGRSVLIDDDFSSLDAAWRVRRSTGHERSAFSNEGKIGEIYTPANTCVFAERALPAGTALVEVALDPGTDRSASWGPGIALVWPDRVVKLNLGSGGYTPAAEPAYGFFDGTREHYNLRPAEATLDVGVPLTMRLRIERGTVHAEARQRGGPWAHVAEIRLPRNTGDPTAVRIGKIGKHGGSADFNGPAGDWSRLRVLSFSACTDLSPAADAPWREDTSRRNIRVAVHYELYDGIPCISKWLTVHNNTAAAVRLDGFRSETLALVEYGSHPEASSMPFHPPNVWVETDYAMGGATAAEANRFAVHWVRDPQFSSQVDYPRNNPCLLEVGPALGPGVAIEPGDRFTSFRAFVLSLDSYERERNGLAQRRLYRVLAPWVTENPLMMHVRRADDASVKMAIDQCADVGFEMVILTFGSGFNIEDERPGSINRLKALADYAHAKGIEIGGYSLLASRRVGGGHDVVMPPGEAPRFGNSPCLGSGWGQDYFRKLYAFYKATGFDLLEHDGSYPGDPCTAGDHPGHAGHADSRWKQHAVITAFYRWCRGRGMFLNVPDWYHLAGSNKTGMGYREVNWSLPRSHQVIHTRQNIYDGTWRKTPSMGWMFVPLTQYHGGGAAATIEPLVEHLDHYERMVQSNLALGVQACYRGPRLYDTPRTRGMLLHWVKWYKAHRDILESDLIHGRRADGRDPDWMLHVNPELPTRGLLAVFNPKPVAVEKDIRVRLYYTGLKTKAAMRMNDGPLIPLSLRPDASALIPVRVGARGMTWVTFHEPEP